MNEFRPKVLLSFTRYVIVIFLFLISFSILQNILVLYAGMTYIFIELINYLYKKHIHLVNHRRLKSYGLSVAWIQLKHLHAKFSYTEFFSIFESCLNNNNWREQFLKMLTTADFICTYDTLSYPYKLRWSLNLNFIDTWTDTDKLASLIALMSGLPESQPWRLSCSEVGAVIETYMYPIDKAVISIEDSPVEALNFWYTFNNDLIWLLNNFWCFKQPIFKQGIVEYIFFELPAKFSLSEGSYLTVTQAENKLKVDSFDINNQKGETMFYVDEREFWSVWRYAIQDAIFDDL